MALNEKEEFELLSLEREKHLSGSNNKRLDVIDKVLASGMTPEDMNKAGHWVAGGLQQTAKDVLSIPAAAFNQFLLNNPRGIAKDFGLEYPEAQSGVASALAKAAGVYGGLKNPIAKAMGGVSGVVARPYLSAALTGAAFSPEKASNIPQRAIQAVIPPMVMKGSSMVAPAVSSVVNRVQKTKFARKVISDFTNKANKMYASFGNVLSNFTEKNPSVKVNLETAVGWAKLRDENGSIVTSGKAMNAIHGDKILSKIYSGKGYGEVTAKQAYEIANKLSKANKGNDYDLNILINDIKNAVADIVPELADEKGKYKVWKKSYDLLKPKFKELRILGNLNKGFGDEMAVENLKNVVSKKTFRAIKNYKTAGTVARTIPKIIKAGAIAGLGLAGIKKLSDFTGE